MKTRTPAIEISGLNVRFNSLSILRDINFKLEPGEIVAVIGPNGAGKTTLFRAILGLIPFDGSIRVLGSPTKKALGQLGYVPQRFSFDRSFPLRVREFLSLSLRGPDTGLIERSLSDTEMLGRKDSLIGSLSGGQLQRVLMARALMGSPDILLLDEPTAGVDLEGESGFYDIIKKQNASRGVTSLVITHEINMVYKYATRVICLNRDIYCHGTPKESITRELLSRLYGKDVVMRGHSH